MKIRVSKEYQIIYFILSVQNILLIFHWDISYFTYAIFVFILMLALIKKMDAEEFLLYSLFIPNKYLQIFAIPLFLVFSHKILKPQFNKKTLIFFMLITVSGIVNCLVYDGLIIATLFQVGFYYCIILLMRELNREINVKKIVRHLDFIFILEVVASVLEFVITRKFGDYLRGTFESAHYFGVFLLLYLYLLFKVKDSGKGKLDITIRCILDVVILYLSDAKHVIAIVAFSMVWILILKKLRIKNELLVTSSMMIVCVVAGLIFLKSEIGQTMISKFDLASYVINSQYNLKYRYLQKTFDEMKKSINGLVGFGPGQFGSQISLTMSKGQAYPWDSNLSAYQYAIKPYANVLNNLFSEWYVGYGIVMSSMVLGYPLISFVGMIAEIGLIGYLLFFNIIDKIYAGKNKAFIVAFVLMTMFDTYFEIACVFVLMLIVTSISQRKGRILIEK